MSEQPRPIDPAELQTALEDRAYDLNRANSTLRDELQQILRESSGALKQLAEQSQGLQTDRAFTRAALNLLEDAVRARLAERRENDRRRRIEDELREADRRKNEFLATLAHELRAPLAPIRNS